MSSPLAGQMLFRASLFGAFGQSKKWLGTNADGTTRALTTADFYKAGLPVRFPILTPSEIAVILCGKTFVTVYTLIYGAGTVGGVTVRQQHCHNAWKLAIDGGAKLLFAIVLINCCKESMTKGDSFGLLN